MTATLNTTSATLKAPVTAGQVKHLLASAAARLAPQWPLHDLVAVNPYVGLSELPFAQAAALLPRLGGPRLTHSGPHYRRMLADGRIAANSLAAVCAANDGAPAPGAVQSALAFPAETAQVMPRVSALLSGQQQALEQLIQERLGAFLARAAQNWPLDLYAEWLEQAQIDRTPDHAGFPGLRQIFAGLPQRATVLIETALNELQIPVPHHADWLHALGLQVAGWAGLVRGLDFHAGTQRVEEILTLCAAWELALWRWAGAAHATAYAAAWEAFQSDWVAAEARAALVPCTLAQEARDLSAQSQLAQQLLQAAPKPELSVAAHLVFCIDVRSERLRRHLEAQDAQLRTSGFAGFFGLPLALEQEGAPAVPLCPVLLQPRFTLKTLSGAQSLQQAQQSTQWKHFTGHAHGSLLNIEATGLSGLWTLAKKTWAALPGFAQRPQPSSPALVVDLPLEQRLALVQGMCAGLGWQPKQLPKLVVFVGHAGHSTNNSHHHGLDCGACGGHGGAANARLAAHLANDPEVRASLGIPEHTWFVAGLHETTTDQVLLLDSALAPASHQPGLQQLQQQLQAACAAVRMERAPSLGLSGTQDPLPVLVARSQDWAEPRPEWALAGNRAFVAAPRSYTRGLNLGGQVFLHDYDAAGDQSLALLKQILAAPVVVASWINLQYYGSTLDPKRAGAGDKPLHNRIGTLGVLAGTGGDLQVGLPWQSVHDGEKAMHQALRLCVVIATHQEQLEQALQQVPMVRTLVDNGWIHLCAWQADGIYRREAAGQWQALAQAEKAVSA